MQRHVAAVLVCLLTLSSLPFGAAVQAQAPLGTRVQAPGGWYTDLAPRTLAMLIQHKHFLLINVHIPYAGELPHTDAFIPYNMIDPRLTQLPARRGAMIVVYCRTGVMGAIAARRLVALHFTSVYNLAGGMRAWQRAGLPLLYHRQARQA